MRAEPRRAERERATLLANDASVIASASSASFGARDVEGGSAPMTRAGRGQTRTNTTTVVGSFVGGACAVLAMAYGVVLSSNASARGSSAALGVASVEVNGGAVDAAPSVVEFVKPFAGHFKSIGDWPEEYMVPVHPAAALGKWHPAGRLGSWAHPNQQEINTFINDWSAKSVAEMPHATYTVPPSGKAKAVRAVNGTPMFYNFVHVPKAGGTYFSVFMSHAMEKSGERHGYPYPMNAAPFNSWITLPLVDLSQNNVMKTAEHYRTREPAQYFATETLRTQYAAGKRLFGKGQYGMGMCDDMEVPCVYLTVLRDPVERYLSHYKYSCLNGAEGRAQWLDEWKKQGACPLDPIEFMDHLGPNLDWIVQIAPGTATDPAVHVAKAKANLGSACFRYLLMEQYQDGLNKMRSTFSDFEGVHDVTDPHMMNPSKPMSADTKARYDKYMANATIMETIVARHKHMKEVYDYAVAHYESHWASPIATC
jgi:hypothetical protein